MTMYQWLSSLALDQIEALGGLEIDMDWWWPGHETDPVVSCEHLEIAGTYMTLLHPMPATNFNVDWCAQNIGNALIFRGKERLMGLGTFEQVDLGHFFRAQDNGTYLHA